MGANKSLSTFFLCLSISLFGCADRGSENEAYSVDYLDDVQYLHGHFTLDGGLASEIVEIITHQDQVLVLQDLVDNDDKKIVSLSTDDLKERWTWSEAFDEYGIRGFGDGRWSENSSIFGGDLIVGDFNVIYKIDLSSGSTSQKSMLEFNITKLYGSNSVLSTMTRSGDFESCVYMLDVDDFSMSETGCLSSVDPFRMDLNNPMYFEEDGINYLAFVYGNVRLGSLEQYYWLSLYDIDRGEKVWQSDTIPTVLPGGRMGNRIRYSNGKLILANNMIYAYNVEDGTLAWSRDYGNSFILSSHPIVANGYVYANNDSGFMVCLDVRNGREAWRTETGGSPSPIVYHDDRIYMSNVTQPGGNSLLVIDAWTGEILYDVVAPYDPDVDPSPLFNDAIAVDPETGYVYTGNYRDLLVYDFP